MDCCVCGGVFLEKKSLDLFGKKRIYNVDEWHEQKEIYHRQKKTWSRVKDLLLARLGLSDCVKRNIQSNREVIQAKGSLVFPFHITETEEDEMHARIKSVKAIQDDHNQFSLSYCWGVTFLGLWYSCQWRDGEEKSLIGLVGWGWKETFSVWSSTGSLDNSLYKVLHTRMGSKLWQSFRIRNFGE